MSELGFEPVFVMGPHRSGTTILYKVLAATGLFNVTTAYHVLNSSRLREIHESGGEAQARADLERLFESLGLRNRQFDAMPISPDLPEEYAWALRYQGRRPRLDASNLPSFIQFCRDVNASQNPGRPLLLKNPFDAANFAYMAAAFPTARFVQIHRNPVDVINSQVRAVRSLLAQKNEYVALVVRRYRELYERPARLALARLIYSERLPLLVTQVMGTVTRVNDYFLRRGGELGSRAFNLTYNELCARPAQTIGRIVDFAGLRDTSGVDYAGLVQPREPELLAEVSRRRDSIRARNAEYCRRFGF
jgi:hypothetical protein